MSNNIPIDELFREKLSGGKEQLNLGAWANMERMLNGQNPYATEEPKRKRRILPLMIIFALLGTAVSAGLFWINSNKHTPQYATTAPQTAPIPVSTDQQIEADPSKGEASPSTASSIAPNQINLQPRQKQVANAVQKHHRSTDNAFAGTDIDPNTAAQNTNMTGGNDGHLQSHQQNRKQADPGIALASNDPKSGLGLKKDYKSLDQQAMGLDALSAVNDKEKKVTNAKPGTKNIKVNRIVANVRESRNRNGSASQMIFDTVGQSTIEIEKAIALAESEKQPKDKNYKWHPRYLVEQDAQVDPQQQVINSQPPALAAAVSVSNPKPQVVNDEKSNKNAGREKKNVIAALGAFTGATLAKIGEESSNFFRMFGVLDPGISLGVNAALFNTKNNYGGFHAGITNHTAISETFSILSEVKFFMRNNAGYTVNDIKTIIKNYSVDTFSVPGSTVYKYDVDSTTKRYNFKNFMSLELPIMLSAKFNNLSVYGGPNFAYNFKLNINEVTTNYTDPKYVNKEFTLANGTPFEQPVDKSYQYVRSDFGSRFGIGYAIGVSYNFNPNIYLDLRLSKQMWDNTKTNTQRAVSNGVTKVPFTQLSLGYKFKK